MWGGGNIVHWDFTDSEGTDQDEEPNTDNIDARMLCGEAIVIMDRDNTDSEETKDAGKHDRRVKLKQMLGDRLLVTFGREVENMLPPSVIRDTMIALETQKNSRRTDRDDHLKQFTDKLIADPNL